MTLPTFCSKASGGECCRYWHNFKLDITELDVDLVIYLFALYLWLTPINNI